MLGKFQYGLQMSWLLYRSAVVAKWRWHDCGQGLIVKHGSANLRILARGWRLASLMDRRTRILQVV